MPPRKGVLRLVKPEESKPVTVTGFIDANGLVSAVRSKHYQNTPRAGVMIIAAITEAMRLVHDAECWRRLRGLAHWSGEPGALEAWASPSR